MSTNRRDFIKKAALGAAGLGLATVLPEYLFAAAEKDLFFKFAISQFSFANEFWTKQLDPLDFAAKSKELGISGLDYCSMFFADKAKDQQFLGELKKRAADNGSYNLRIMVDGEGVLGDLTEATRLKAVDNHHKWIDAAAALGCPMIRVNVEGEGDPKAVAGAAVDSLGRLIEYGKKDHIDVIVENHVGISCNAGWLAGVMKQLNSPHCGTLADFGNFCINRTKPETQDIAGYMKTRCLEEYDKYKGIEELMPYAKGVHVKSHIFDASGNDVETDFYRMFKIIKQSGFTGWASIEYEGGLLKAYTKDSKYLDDYAGVTATKNLAEKAGRAA